MKRETEDSQEQILEGIDALLTEISSLLRRPTDEERYGLGSHLLEYAKERLLSMRGELTTGWLPPRERRYPLLAHDIIDVWPDLEGPASRLQSELIKTEKRYQKL